MGFDMDMTRPGTWMGIDYNSRRTGSLISPSTEARILSLWRPNSHDHSCGIKWSIGAAGDCRGTLQAPEGTASRLSLPLGGISRMLCYNILFAEQSVIYLNRYFVDPSNSHLIWKGPGKCQPIHKIWHVNSQKVHLFIGALIGESRVVCKL